MSEQLFDKFADLQALEKEKQVVMSLFDEIKKGIEQLSKVGVKIEASKGIRDTSEAIKELQKLEAELLQTEKQLSDRKLQLAEAEKKVAESTKLQTAAINTENNSFRQQVGTIDENIKKREELRSKLSQVRADLKKLRDFDGANQPQLLNEIVKLGKLESELTTQIQYANAAIKTQQKLQLSVNNSLEEAKIKLVELRKERDRQDLNTDTGRSEKERLNAEIDALDALVEHETDLYQKRKINVGNYQGSAKIIVESLKDVEKEISILQQKQQGLVNFSKSNPIGFKVGGGQDSLNQVTAQLGFATKQAEALNNVVANPQFLNISAKAGDAIAETRFFTKALIDLEQQGQKDTQAYRDLQAQLANLTDTIADTRAEVKALGSDTRGFDLFASAVGTVSSTFQTAASAAELFKGDNEQVQKSIQKLVAIQNISNGIRQIATDLTTRGSAANKAYAFVQAQVATLTNASATATEKWMVALKGIGIIALVSGLIYLADKMGIFGDSAEDATSDVDKLTESLEQLRNETARIGEDITRASKIDLAKLKANGASAEALYEREKKALEDRRDLLLSEGTVIQAQKGKLFAQEKEDSEEYKKLTDAALQNEKEYYDVVGQLEENAYNEQTRINAKNEEARKKKTEADKKSHDENLKQAAAERRAALELQKFRLELEADAAGATKEQGPVSGRILAAQTEFELRKKIIEKQKEIELSSEKLTASQRQLILDKAAVALINLEAQTGADILRIRQDFANAGQDEAAVEAQRLQEQEDAKIQAKIDASKNAFERYQKEQEKQASEDRAKATNIYKKELSENKKRFDEGLINYENYKKEYVLIENRYNQEIESINYKSHQNILQNELRFAEEQIDILKKAGFDTLEAELQIAKIKEQIAQFGSESMADAIKQIKEFSSKQEELIENIKQKRQELRESIASALNNVIDGAFDARKNEIQEQIDLVDTLKAAEIDRINATTDSEEKKAAKVKLIEAKAQNDREALERRQRDIDRRKAIFDRAFRAFQITTAGIEQVAKIKLTVAELTAKSASNPLLIPLIAVAASQIPIAIATTAANLVGLLATPIPKYAKGTNYSKEGPAIVGEAGREIGIDPSGKVTLYEKPTLTQLARGTKILPTRVTEDVIAAAESDRRQLMGAFSQNITIAGNEELVESNRKILGELESINKKSRIVIVNQGNIESTPWYMQHMKH